MTLKSEFEKTNGYSSYRFDKDSSNPYVLLANYDGTSSTTRRIITYDFLARIMIVSLSGVDSGATVVPFSQLDRESLEFMRDKLIEKGGKPPALPEIENANPMSSIGRKSTPKK